MSPIHLIIWASAVLFQLMNGISIGGYLAGYDSLIINSDSTISKVSTIEYPIIDRTIIIKKTTVIQLRLLLGTLIWTLGFIGNIFHDEVLRNIRRDFSRKQMGRTTPFDKKFQGTNYSDRHTKINLGKHYQIPSSGLFRWILFPHYLCEWFEWIGWWVIAGPSCQPARIFVINLIATMTPRAVQGRNWYIKNFGAEKLYGRKAIIPGIL